MLSFGPDACRFSSSQNICVKLVPAEAVIYITDTPPLTS
jgi:hypothetical protein